jgi:hypothetical protein
LAAAAGSKSRSAGAALIVVGALAVVGAGVLGYLRVTGEDLLATRARGAAQDLSLAVGTLKRDLGRQLDEAAEIHQFRAAVENRADALTFVDLFDNEDWWAPYRARGVAIGRNGDLLVARGIDAEVARRLVRHAEGQVPGVVESGRDLLLVAAGTYPMRRATGSFTLILTRPLDTSTVGALLGATIGAAALSDGRQVRVTAGAPGLVAAAAALVGREREATFVGPTGAWVGAALPLAGDSSSINVWALGLGKGGAWTPPLPLIVAAVALGLLLLGGGVVLVRRRPMPKPGPMMSPLSMSVPGRASAKRTGIDIPGGRGSSLAHPRFPPSGPSQPSSGVVAVGRSSLGRPTAAATAALANRAPQQFGRYKLIERIAEGGMADVFTAVLSGAEGFERLLVIKRLKPHLALNPDAVNQFIDEAKLGSRLTHPNIVTVLDFGKVGDGFYLAQEYVLGRTLAQIGARHQERFGRPVPPAIVLYIAHEVLGGLSYAHERTDDQGRPLEIVHRDVSPSNVMVSMQGEVKLLDFGIVKAAERVSKTSDGNVKGNVGFMAPEQARGLDTTARSDLFSLGLVLFDLLSGEPFYVGSGMGEVLYRAATGPTAEHLARIDLLPQPAPAFLRRVLAVEPEGRYPSARAFSEALAPAVSIGKSQLSEMMRALFSAERT